MSAVIEAIGVTRRFASPAGVIVAVDRVSFTLRSGELVGLVGPSGSGKTTLLNLIVGWDRVDEGAIARDVRRGWSGIAVVPQGIGLLAELTAGENVGVPARLGHESRRPLDDLLDDVALGGLGDRLPDELSLGEQQRVAVARATAVAPSLLVADEPTAHQDELNARRISAALAECAAAGSAVVLSTHDERMLEGVDRVLTMRDGRVDERPGYDVMSTSLHQ